MSLMHRLARALLPAALACAPAWALAQASAPAESRGKLLYETHCITCHTTQMHWREGKLGKDWPSLKAQVLKWQANAGLQWSDADITEVARHLNDTIYKLPQTGDRVSLAPASAR
jgi:mono/diheme cytochrome c family protein